MKPQLSIVVPSYNHRHFIVDTLLAIENIPVTKEVIVIDDGSQDGSPEHIQKWIETVPSRSNFKLIARENRGLVRTLNEGLNIAIGTYIYIVASDDIPIPSSIGELITQMEQYPSFAFVCGNALAFSNKNELKQSKVVYEHRHLHFFNANAVVRNKDMFLSYPSPILLQATVFKRQTLISLGGWDETLMLDDYPMFIRLFRCHPDCGIDFKYFPDVSTVLYRQHSTNAYYNINRQVEMVEESLQALCPQALINTALANNYVFYSLIAIKARMVTIGLELFRKAISRCGVTSVVKANIMIIYSFITHRLHRLFITSGYSPDTSNIQSQLTNNE